MKKFVIFAVLIVIIVIIFLTRLKFSGLVFKTIKPEGEGTIEKNRTIRLSSTVCTDGKLSMDIANDGSMKIEKSELKVTINDEDKTVKFIDKGIEPNDVTSYSDLNTVYSGKLNIKVEGPDNTIGWGITC